MEPRELTLLVSMTIEACLLHHADAVGDLMLPLFQEADATDCLVWTMGMVGVVTMNEPNRPGEVATPMVATRQPDGSMAPASLDDAPLPVASFARLCAAHVNHDPDTIRSVWHTLLDADTDGTLMARCMSYALRRATECTAARRAQLQ